MSFKIVAVNINQTCLGLSTASVTLRPDVNDPLTTQEIRDLLGAPVQITWPDNQFSGFVDQLTPSLSVGQQFLQLNILTDSERMHTSPWLRIFTNKSLKDIVAKIALDNNRNITFLGQNPNVIFSIQQYEDDISYLSRLAEEYGKIFFDDGQGLNFIDWTGGEQAVEIQERQLNHIDMTLNMIPCSLELHGRLSNAGGQQNLSTEINTPNVEPLRSVYSESESVYDSATMYLPHLVDPENSTKDHPTLVRRQVRQMVRIQVGSSINDLTLGKAIAFNDVSIVEDGQRFRIAEIHHVFGERDTYSNNFTALSDDILATPSPVSIKKATPIHTLRARVSNVKDEKSLGRIKVLFPEADYSDESPFIPILTPFTGNGGVFAHPEIGDEVLLMATNGALEKSPVIIGSFYSANTTATNWQNGEEVIRGFQSGNVGIFIHQDTGKLVVKANEISFEVNENMKIEVTGELTQKAGMIQLNP